MTTVDIVVIVLCVVVVAAVGAAALWRKIKGKPSGCADCSHCGGQCTSRPAPRGAKEEREEGSERAAHVCAHCSPGCHGCSQSSACTGVHDADGQTKHPTIGA